MPIRKDSLSSLNKNLRPYPETLLLTLSRSFDFRSESEVPLSCRENILERDLILLMKPEEEESSSARSGLNFMTAVLLSLYTILSSAFLLRCMWDCELVEFIMAEQI